MQNRMTKKTLLLIFLLFQSTFSYGQIYKFKDEQGKWHFSDKKPISPNTSLQKIKIKSSPKTKNIRPYLEVKQANGQLRYIVHNPLLAPVQFFLRDTKTTKKIATKVLEPLSSQILFKQQNSLLKRDIDFRYVIGDPTIQVDNALILPPFADYKPMKISQGFNGRFSHKSIGSRYAVDIALPVGTKITAVQEGIVIRTKDDYALAGVSSPFFFDKANLVEILHSDGTFAVYAHLLLGGVKVKVGDKVSAGQVIGLSGNTGYSTGPHLHFVIRYNKKGKNHSLPFKFLQADKKQVIPKEGDWLLPSNTL